MKRSVFVCLLLSVGFINRIFASDTTYRKKPLYFSINAGFTINRMFGTVMDNEKTFNSQFGIHNASQKDGVGWALGVSLRKQLGQIVYFKTGLTYLQKQVNPEEGGFMLYKDSLKTGYLSIPALAGIMTPLDRRQTTFLSFELGPAGDFRLTDHARAGIDRAKFATHFATLSLQAGCGLTMGLPSGICIQLHYSYMVNMTEAYKETLYWGNPTYRDFSYKYRTQFVSFGLQWPM